MQLSMMHICEIGWDGMGCDGMMTDEWSWEGEVDYLAFWLMHAFDRYPDTLPPGTSRVTLVKKIIPLWVPNSTLCWGYMNLI